ncbi:MAG: hypothetical protein WA840_04820 [Caulobacteraceae bacterium]
MRSLVLAACGPLLVLAAVAAHAQTPSGKAPSGKTPPAQASAVQAPSGPSADQDFRELCFSHKAERKATLAAADAAGWRKEAKPPEGPTSLGFMTVKTYETRVRTLDPASRKLVVGEGDLLVGAGTSAPARACMIVDPTEGAASLAGEKAALNGPALMQNNVGSMYLVDSHTGATLPKDVGPEKLKGGDVALVMLVGRPQSAAFAYVIGQPKPN